MGLQKVSLDGEIILRVLGMNQLVSQIKSRGHIGFGEGHGPRRDVLGAGQCRIGFQLLIGLVDRTHEAFKGLAGLRH